MHDGARAIRLRYPDAPPEIIERLAVDPDALIAQNAKRPLERLRKAGSV